MHGAGEFRLGADVDGGARRRQGHVQRRHDPDGDLDLGGAVRVGGAAEVDAGVAPLGRPQRQHRPVVDGGYRLAAFRQPQPPGTAVNKPAQPQPPDTAAQP